MNSTPTPTSKEEMLGYVLAYENGAMSTEEVAVWFGVLIDNGWIWQLPTDYLDVTITLKTHGILWPERHLN